MNRKGKRSAGSINREMSMLRHIFTKSIEWEFIESSPFDRGKSLQLKENNQRLRFLSLDEIQALLDECRPQYLKDIVEYALNTGMRRGEILTLKWDQVQNGFIYLTKTKTSEPRQIPKNDALDVMFKRIRRRQHLRSLYVFAYEGKPKRNIRWFFLGALIRPGIIDIRFHDLRHTFASQLFMKGGTIKDAQELLGHANVTMTMRYTHSTQEHKKGGKPFERINPKIYVTNRLFR